MDLDDTRAKWVQMYETLSARIESGEYPKGSRVPSVITLATEFGTAQATAQKALRALREAGLVRTEQGLGSYVN
jgi:DNA-binding GntR family transcriptional regulator